MSSVSVRFNSFFLSFIRFSMNTMPQGQVTGNSEEWRGVVENRLRCSSLLFHFYFLPLTSPNSVRLWSVWMDSNHRPHAYQACALTTWATNRVLTHLVIGSLHRSSSILWSTGGDDGVRTHDPLLAGQVLSQLSYTPVSGFCFVLFQRSDWSLKIEQQKFHTSYAQNASRHVSRLRQLREKLSWSP